MTNEFRSKTAHGLCELLRMLGGLPKNEWVFRGDPASCKLQTYLERACARADVPLQRAAGIENEMIREFQRVYDGDDRDLVRNDTLYCLSLMQHHGAPTRLLDWTYSPFVAAYFALQKAYDDKRNDGRSPIKCTVWCLNTDWCKDEAKRIAGGYLINGRNDDRSRTDETFVPLYMRGYFTLVFLENPLGMHIRLRSQQGVFLCPGNVSVPFEDNFEQYQGRKENLFSIPCEFDNTDKLLDALGELRRMNIFRETLFPGLDGFAQSMKYRLRFFRDQANRRANPDPQRTYT